MRALQEYGLSQVRACAIIGQPRRTLHYCTKPKNDSEIAERIQVLAQQRPRWGWRRLLIMIRRDKRRRRRVPIPPYLPESGAASTPAKEAQGTLHPRQRYSGSFAP